MYTGYKRSFEDKKHVDGEESKVSQGSGVSGGMKGTGRFRRYVDKSHFYKSKTFNDLRPFYNGVTLNHRMAEIRKSINYIRQNWQDYNQFLASLKELLLKDGEMTFENEEIKVNSESLLTSKRDWMTRDEAMSKSITYDAIKVYTAQEGYDKMYRLSNHMFREGGSAEVSKEIQNVVFLVELINIDLYNYCMKFPNLENFEGKVYRGLCIDDADCQAFRSLRNEPISRRNIAVPLGMFSGTSDLEVAKSFIEEGLEETDEESAEGESKETDSKKESTKNPLLIIIHVIGLKKEYVEHYTKRFPSTVLTTICAVDVHKLSMYPPEKEVLLRGPFMQVLHMYKDDHDLLGRPCDVVEVVMLNANRDHISTSLLGDQMDLARDLFGTMVAVTRSEFAVNLCKEKGLFEDAKEYQAILDDNLLKLNDLIAL